jgi:hypothetical protein
MIEVSRFVCRVLAIAAVGVAMTAPAFARHDEMQDDPAVVTERLNHMGFMGWHRLKWDHGFWKVDDARRANGYDYDLELEAGTLDLVRLKREGRH